VVAQEELDRVGEPLAAERVALSGRSHVPEPPPAEGAHDRVELFAGFGQPDQRRGDGRWRFLPADQARRLKLADPVGEQVGRDSRQPVLQVGVPAGAADEQLPDDQQCPAVTHDVERLGDRTVLAVTTHKPRLSDHWLRTKIIPLTFST
jgi:hypothetical protein